MNYTPNNIDFNETKLLFITTTISTKWLNYSQTLMRNAFPNSKFVVVDGSKSWPNSWLYWLTQLDTNYDYFIHFDEDFFLTSKDELIKCVQKMISDNIHLYGTPDGLNMMRGANPVAMNSFFMIGDIQKMSSIDFELDTLQFNYSSNGWLNNKNEFNQDWSQDIKFSFPTIGEPNYSFEQEPYYYFMWKCKQEGLKFDYLYPFFDKKYSSTNPRILENSDDIGIHMWYARQWSDSTNVHGLINSERYNRVEDFLKNSLL